MKKILIIHPEGNINNNPNLSGLVEILCENEHAVDIYSLHNRAIYQNVFCGGAKLILVDKDIPSTAGFVILAGHSFDSAQKIVMSINNMVGDCDLIIGVDRGIIEAALIAKVKQVPYGLISYEIFYEEECGKEFKKPEIEACKSIAFAVCQGNLRAEHLSKENRIASKKIIKIPLGGRFVKKGEKNSYLYDTLAINKAKKIALFIGQVAEWTMTDVLMESTKYWPDDWVLVIHNRYQLNNELLRHLKNYSESGNIYLSMKPIPDPNQMHRLIHSADIGFALYKPLKNDIWAGNNIKNIGMASGKIAMYLQHGIPIVVNEIGEMSDYVRKYGLGIVVNDTEKIRLTLTDNELKKCKKNCCEFFEIKIDLNNTVQPLLEVIQSLLERK